MRLIVILIAVLISACVNTGDWRTADRGSAGLAPLPSMEPEAVVAVYVARTVSWRGYFAVHSWIATKEKGAGHYMTYHVIGFRLRRGLPVVAVEEGIPDGKWFGAMPYTVQEIRGKAAEAAIPKILAAARSYPYQNTYRAWPGPNSNTFVSHILRHVAELGVELPSNAIGKDWLADSYLVDWSETKTGVQLSMLGILGLTAGLGDGVEVNILGFSTGIDLWRPALKLPFVGRIGFTDAPVFK